MSTALALHHHASPAREFAPPATRRGPSFEATNAGGHHCTTWQREPGANAYSCCHQRVLWRAELSASLRAVERRTADFAAAPAQASVPPATTVSTTTVSGRPGATLTQRPNG